MSGSAWPLYGQTGPQEPPSQQSEGIGYPGPPTLADRDRLGKAYILFYRFRPEHLCLVVAYTHSPWNCKMRVLIIDNTVRESRLCILLKDNRPTPGVIVDKNLVYVQNFTPGRTYVLFLDSNGNPGHLGCATPNN